MQATCQPTVWSVLPATFTFCPGLSSVASGAVIASCSVCAAAVDTRPPPPPQPATHSAPAAASALHARPVRLRREGERKDLVMGLARTLLRPDVDVPGDVLLAVRGIDRGRGVD